MTFRIPVPPTWKRVLEAMKTPARFFCVREKQVYKARKGSPLAPGQIRQSLVQILRVIHVRLAHSRIPREEGGRSSKRIIQNELPPLIEQVKGLEALVERIGFIGAARLP
jgi:hypothetical protein